MARYGLRAEDVFDVVETGLGGENVTTTIEGRERFPIQVRFERDERDDIERLGDDARCSRPPGPTVPLGQVANIKRVVGPSEIASENGRLRVFVQANVQGPRPGRLRQGEQASASPREIKLAPGMTIEWTGPVREPAPRPAHPALRRPRGRADHLLLLYMVFRSAKEAAHVILAVPFALSGGVFLQYLLGYNFSVAVWVGYIALFGTAIETGIVMVVYLEEASGQERAERGAGSSTHADLIQAVKDGARLRLRPKVMTVATTVAALLPIMWSTSTGVGSHAAAGHAGHRRHDQQPAPHPDRHPGPLRLAARAQARPSAVGRASARPGRRLDRGVGGQSVTLVGLKANLQVARLDPIDLRRQVCRWNVAPSRPAGARGRAPGQSRNAPLGTEGAAAPSGSIRAAPHAGPEVSSYDCLPLHRGQRAPPTAHWGPVRHGPPSGSPAIGKGL